MPSGFGDAEADLWKMIHDSSQLRNFALDRNLVNGVHDYSPRHWIEAVVIRRYGDAGARQQFVWVARVNVLVSGGSAVLRNLESFVGIHRTHVAVAHRVDALEPAHQVRELLREPERGRLGAQEPHRMEAGGVGEAERIAEQEWRRPELAVENLEKCAQLIACVRRTAHEVVEIGALHHLRTVFDE